MNKMASLVTSLQAKLKRANQNLRRSRMVANLQKTTVRKKDAEVNKLKEDYNDLTQMIARQQEKIHLKDPVTGHFSKETIKCVILIELLGEKEVSATRCADVIQTVCKHLVGVKIPSSELPSLRSVLRFSDRGHVMSKLQVADAILQSAHFDIHTDGTTKCGKKIIGQQVTVDDGTSLACGFSIVAVEDTTTLMDVTTSLLRELTDVCGKKGDAADELFKKFLRKISATMSDRAAVNKSFNNALNNMRKTSLDTDEDLDFLHCNAHFLLGLANSAEKTLKAILTTPVGREKSAKFAGYKKKENVISRLVREACTVLGPRGDERYSCRDSWLAYCALQGLDSSIPAYKGNRFNMLFSAAAAVYFHRSDLEDFLGNYMVQKNWKQDGMLHDVTCDGMDAILVVLGIIYCRITQPYWQLLGRSIAYLDFYQHVVLLHSFLQRWAEQLSTAFARDFEPLFNIPVAEDNVFLSLVNTSEKKQENAAPIIQALCTGFLEVLRRQLHDFLPSGKYHAVADEGLRNKLCHSKLTNMFGEQCFGDLDFSLFKRRNASAHHLSTLNMLNRNKPVSSFLENLSENDQAVLFKASSCLSKSLRQKHRQQEKDAVEKKRQDLEAKKAKKESVALKKSRQKETIIERVRIHDGPCRNEADVCRLLTHHRKTSAKLLVVKAELQFQRIVLDKKSPLLKTTLPLNQMVSNLKLFRIMSRSSRFTGRLVFGSVLISLCAWICCVSRLCTVHMC